MLLPAGSKPVKNFGAFFISHHLTLLLGKSAAFFSKTFNTSKYWYSFQPFRSSSVCGRAISSYKAMKILFKSDICRDSAMLLYNPWKLRQFFVATKVLYQGWRICHEMSRSLSSCRGIMIIQIIRYSTFCWNQEFAICWKINHIFTVWYIDIL